VIRRLFDDVTGDPMARSSSMIGERKLQEFLDGPAKRRGLMPPTARRFHLKLNLRTINSSSSCTPISIGAAQFKPDVIEHSSSESKSESSYLLFQPKRDSGLGQSGWSFQQLCLRSP
jgi:hypothetical protein